MSLDDDNSADLVVHNPTLVRKRSAYETRSLGGIEGIVFSLPNEGIL